MATLMSGPRDDSGGSRCRDPQPVDKYHVPQWLGKKATRRFHVMAKPAGSACNLDCAYCFYLSKEKLTGGPGPGRMGDQVLEAFVKGYIESVTGDEVVFSWQGGEPTLLGIPFFEKAVALQRKYAKPGQRIANDLQTNGTLLDEDWARFLKANRFLVGLSIDGPRELHDKYRVTKRGEPTFDKVYAAAQMLRKFGVPFNTLTCVRRYNVIAPARCLPVSSPGAWFDLPTVHSHRRAARVRGHGPWAYRSFAVAARRDAAGQTRPSPLDRDAVVGGPRRVRLLSLQSLG